MNFLKPTAIAASMLLLFLSCNNPTHQKELASDMQLTDHDHENKKEEFQNPPGYYNTKDQTTDTAKEIRASSKPDWDKKIIKTGVLKMEVKDFRKFNELLRTNIKQSGGYIAQEEQNESEYKIENVVTIKVPVDQFDNTVLLITAGNEKLVDIKINSDDVTTEMVDVKSRMEAKKQVRQRYIDLLKQAKNMAEILQVQKEINDIQVEIESAAGRVQYLGHSSAFSTIHLTFYQILVANNIDGKPSFFARLKDSFGIGGAWAAELILGIITLWPIWTLIGLTVVIYKNRKLRF